jgi:hypothetical protein
VSGSGRNRCTAALAALAALGSSGAWGGGAEQVVSGTRLSGEKSMKDIKLAVLDTLGATLVYHRFESSRLGIDYGREIDLQLQARWHRLTGLIKYASYDAHAFATDTSKFWLQLEYVL